MIYYFSGTGNSLWSAQQLAGIFGERLVSMAEALQNDGLSYLLTDDEKVFFVMPVHSWGPALLALRFIEKLSFENYREQPVFALFTCGDNCGYADKILAKALQKKGVTLTKSFSLQMPNNYILMKGFGIDPETVEQRKLRDAPELLQTIADHIQEQKAGTIYTVGTKPFLKSRFVYPMFKKFAVKKVAFYATEKCTLCGMCAEICPTKTIVMAESKPKWGGGCVQCTACINRCPVRAIEYGKITEDQGRYHHPEI